MRTYKNKYCDAYSFIGDLYYKGEQYEKDFCKASTNYSIAVRLGSIRGIYKLGKCHIRGAGVRKSFTKAKTLLEDADFNKYPGVEKYLKLIEVIRESRNTCEY